MIIEISRIIIGIIGDKITRTRIVCEFYHSPLESFRNIPCQWVTKCKIDRCPYKHPNAKNITFYIQK